MAENSQSNYFDNMTAMVAAGATIKAAAAMCGCSESHGYTLSRTPEFRRRVADLRTEATSAAVGKLSEAASRAVDVLLELMGADQEARDRLTAAKSVLSMLGPLSELGELRARLDALESEKAVGVV